MFLERSIKVNKEILYKTCGVDFHLGYSQSEYDITFLNGNITFVNMVLHWNDIIDIQYQEIENKKFYEICSLYI